MESQEVHERWLSIRAEILLAKSVIKATSDEKAIVEEKLSRLEKEASELYERERRTYHELLKVAPEIHVSMKQKRFHIYMAVGEIIEEDVDGLEISIRFVFDQKTSVVKVINTESEYNSRYYEGFEKDAELYKYFRNSGMREDHEFSLGDLRIIIELIGSLLIHEVGPGFSSYTTKDLNAIPQYYFKNLDRVVTLEEIKNS